MARVRIHQHVNPLAKFYQELPITPLVPAAVFETSDLPIHIDIGCGRGRFLLKMSGKTKDQNFLGVEIREPLVDEANAVAKKYKRKNLHYSFCNAPLDLARLLSETPKELIRSMSIQFPDPWFKKRHAKRRMVNEKLVKTIAELLFEDGFVFVQSDVEELSEEMSELFSNANFEMETLTENMMPFKTEREISVEERGLEVFRHIFRKK